MDVIDMVGEVALVAQDMLPIPLLPDIFKIAALAEPCLDQPPARHEIGITIWQGPDAVQVIGQDDDSVDSEWPFMAHGAKSIAQHVHGSGGSKNGPATGSHHREEKAAAWLECASVSHDFMGIVGLRPAAQTPSVLFILG